MPPWTGDSEATCIEEKWQQRFDADRFFISPHPINFQTIIIKET